MADPIINLDRICYAYQAFEPVLDHLNLSIYEGQRIGLVAPNERSLPASS